MSEDDLEVAPPQAPAAGPGPGTLAVDQPPRLPDDGEPAPPLPEPVIDRVEAVPERFWAPDGAGLLRRALALLVDLSLLAALFALFLLGSSCALRREGIGAAALLSGAGLQATLVPLALLGLLLSLVSHVLFHALAGATPGKRLAGLEVRSGDGSPPTWTEAALRWLGAALGLLSLGLGLAWALFEPRRRGWADLISRTLVVKRGRPDAVVGDALGAQDPEPPWR